MVYAINRVNSDSSILPNVRLGGLGIDDCSSPILSQAFLAQVNEERGASAFLYRSFLAIAFLYGSFLALAFLYGSFLTLPFFIIVF